MFAEGDKVFYKGKGILRKDVPYYVERVVNEFIFIGERRYQSSSFTRKEKEPAVDLPLLQVLTEKVRDNGVGVCSYALEFEDGHRRFQVKDVCHARLTYGGRYYSAEEQGKKLLAVALNVSGHIKKYQVAAASQRYKRHVQYILTESPWKDAFIQKPLGEVYTSGVYLDLTKDFWYCVAAAVALRTGSEFDNCLAMFQRLLDLNYSPNVAYIVSQLSRGLNAFASFAGGHHVFNNTNMTMESYARFFNTGKFNDCCGHSYQNSAEREYRIDPLIQKQLVKNDVDLFSTVVNKLKHIATTEQRGWGASFKSIKFDNPDNLIILANLFAKEIK